LNALLLILCLAAPDGVAGLPDDTARLDVRLISPSLPAGSGARVVLRSTASPDQARTADIPASGSVSLPGLAPDLYEITIEATGFSSGRVEIRLDAREVLRLDATLARSGQGMSSLQIGDRWRNGEGVTFDREWGSALPAGDDIWRLMETTAPFVVVDRMDNGGLGTGKSALAGSRGASWTATTLSFGGVEIGPPGSTGLLAFAMDAGLFDAVSATSGMAPVEIGTPGVAISLVPRRAGAQRGGSIYAAGTSSSMVSENRDPDVFSVQRLTSWFTVGGELGLPIRDGLGVLAAGSFTQAAYRELDSAYDLPADSGSIFAHVVGNRERDQIRFLLGIQGVSHPYDDRRQFADPLVEDRGGFVQALGTWERAPARGGRMMINGGVSSWGFAPLIVDSTGGVVDRITDGFVPPSSASTGAVLWQVGGEFEAPVAQMFNASHSLRAGGTLRHAGGRHDNLARPTVGEMVNGLPARVWIPAGATPADGERALTEAGLYVTDRIALPKLTIDAGIRLDSVSGSATGAENGINWTTVSPRASFRWQPGALGFFGGIGRYASPAQLSLLAYGDPSETVFNVHRWRDPNGNGRVDAGEAGELVARSGRGAAVASIDADLEGPKTMEYTVGAEYRRSRGTLRGALIWRRESSLLGSLNTGVPFATSYRAIQVPDPGSDWDSPADDGTLTIYERLPSSFGRDAFLLTNPDGAEVRHEGIEVTWDVRYPRWRMLLGATAYRSEGLGGRIGHDVQENDQGVVGERFELPGAASLPPGRLYFDRAYMAKWSGMYTAPADVRISGTVRYQDGQAFTRLVVAPDLAGGPEAFEAFDVGRIRFTYTGTIDLRFEKGFELGGRHAVFGVDLFNFTNFANEVEEDPVSGPAFRRPTALQPPFTVRVGLRFSF
jgi:hypothetical protein